MKSDSIYYGGTNFCEHFYPCITNSNFLGDPSLLKRGKGKPVKRKLSESETDSQDETPAKTLRSKAPIYDKRL
jgi:hypothetical protein